MLAIAHQCGLSSSYLAAASCSITDVHCQALTAELFGQPRHGCGVSGAGTDVNICTQNAENSAQCAMPLAVPAESARVGDLSKTSLGESVAVGDCTININRISDRECG